MLGVTVPFYLAAGLAVSDDGGKTFRRASDAPILERTDIDPLLTASPFVMIDNGVWRMWYVSGSAWAVVEERRGIRTTSNTQNRVTASSWIAARPRVPRLRLRAEYAFARPCVRYDGRLYRMWYAYRGRRYRIGYAESQDGITWTRLDHERGLDASGAGWDSEMVEYPWVFEQNGREYMLFNGDDYGRTGVGLAVLGISGPS